MDLKRQKELPWSHEDQDRVVRKGQFKFIQFELFKCKIYLNNSVLSIISWLSGIGKLVFAGPPVGSNDDGSRRAIPHHVPSSIGTRVSTKV